MDEQAVREWQEGVCGLGQEEILVRIMKIGEAFCLLAFLDKKDRDMYLSRSREIFDRWYAKVSPWEMSNLSRANWRWVSVT